MFTIDQIAVCTCGKIIGDNELEVEGISTDSRTIQAGELFIPLVGDNFDGHQFLANMPDKGIFVALASENWLSKNTPPEELTIIVVQDTLVALGNLAQEFRNRYEIPIVGITGSNGKTTTKEMLATILEQLGNGLKTEGNLNNLIGLPKMLFKLRGEHQWSILEMGMSEPGEIDRLAQIAQPQIGVILNAFPAHLESMVSVENVARAKGELLLNLPVGGYAIVNNDDLLISMQPSPADVNRITFGCSDTAQVKASNIRTFGTNGQHFTLTIYDNQHEVSLKAYGVHNIYNALAAAAAATALGIPTELIISGLTAFTAYDKRFNLQQLGQIFLIDDTYNANPASVKAALDTLLELKGNAKTFVALGDMLELGRNEAELHRMVGVQAAKVSNKLYLYGELSKFIAEGAINAGMQNKDIITGKSHAEIAAAICGASQPGDFVLLKGSRGMKMENIAIAMKKITAENNED